MGFKFGKRSQVKLEGVHPDLVRVMELAISRSSLDFAITEGIRTLEKQKEYLKTGASTTLRSRHLTGHTVDVALFRGKELRWDWPLYGKLASIVKIAAVDLQIPIEWGGDWKKFPDGPHFQLPWKDYP